MFQIRPNLFLSGFGAAKTNVQTNAMVINCTHELPLLKPDALRIAVDDIPDSENNRAMFLALPKAVETIKTALDAGRPVVVHCHAGQQRSPTVVAAYLMAHEKYAIEDAIREIRSKKRDALFWHATFRTALEWFEATLK